MDYIFDAKHLEQVVLLDDPILKLEVIKKKSMLHSPLLKNRKIVLVKILIK